MATVTIRNLSDEVVAALKERARRNSRSMEAEVRELLIRVVASGESPPSGLEHEASRQLLSPRRWSIPSDELMNRVTANPPSEKQRRVLADWAAEIEASRAEPFFLDPFDDPWERRDPS